MRERAQKLGATAIVGVDLDDEVLGERNGMLIVSVSGTAVVTDGRRPRARARLAAADRT